MVASRQMEVQFYRGVARQRRLESSSLAKGIRKSAFPFLRKYIVLKAKRVGADLLEVAAPEIAQFVSCRKKFKSAAKSVGRQNLRKHLGSGSRKKLLAESFQQNLQHKPVGRGESFFTKTSHKLYRVIFGTKFCGSCWDLGGKVPAVDYVLLFRERNICPTISLDGNCIEFELQTDRNYYVDWRQTYLAVKLNFVKGRSNEPYIIKEVTKGAQRGGKSL